jgi:hypothetical protein
VKVAGVGLEPVAATADGKSLLEKVDSERGADSGAISEARLDTAPATAQQTHSAPLEVLLAQLNVAAAQTVVNQTVSGASGGV